MSDYTQSYSELAEDYNRVRFSGRTGRFLFERDRDIIRSYVLESGATRILDVPVGTGRVLEYVKDLPIDVVGLDLTREMLADAAKVAHPTRHRLMEGDASKMPFEDREFDCVTSLRFFHLFPPEHRQAFVREFLRVLKPGGHLIVSFTNGWYAGGVNWLRRFAGMRSVYFENPGEMRRLFPGCTMVHRTGNFLPKQWMIDPVPGVGAAVRAATRHAPLNLVCWERIYLLRKG
jgi:SAM-dependent methyltransferase